MIVVVCSGRELSDREGRDKSRVTGQLLSEFLELFPIISTLHISPALSASDIDSTDSAHSCCDSKQVTEKMFSNPETRDMISYLSLIVVYSST